MARTRREWGDVDGRVDPVTAPQPAVASELSSVQRVEPTPWGVPTPQLNSDPTAFLNAMNAAVSAKLDADAARAKRSNGAARRSLRRVF